MRKRLWLVLALAVVTALLAACGGGGAAQTGSSGGTGDANAGKELFAQQSIGTSPGCVTCHTVDGSKRVGPSVKGIASRAGNEVQGESAEQYIHESIVDPNAHAAQGFTVGVMPSFKSVLSDAQVNNLVAYLLSLK